MLLRRRFSFPIAAGDQISPTDLTLHPALPHQSGAADDAQLLGPYIAPENLTTAELEVMPEGCMGASPQTSLYEQVVKYTAGRSSTPRMSAVISSRSRAPTHLCTHAHACTHARSLAHAHPRPPGCLPPVGLQRPL